LEPNELAAYEAKYCGDEIGVMSRLSESESWYTIIGPDLRQAAVKQNPQPIPARTTPRLDAREFEATRQHDNRQAAKHRVLALQRAAGLAWWSQAHYGNAGTKPYNMVFPCALDDPARPTTCLVAIITPNCHHHLTDIAVLAALQHRYPTIHTITPWLATGPLPQAFAHLAKPAHAA
jgi:hypothetical protein